MNKIQVSARFNPDGKIIPTEFTTGGEDITVHDLGRQWQDEEGRHILVMDVQKRTYHLLFKPQEVTWYLVRDISSPQMPT